MNPTTFKVLLVGCFLGWGPIAAYGCLHGTEKENMKCSDERYPEASKNPGAHPGGCLALPRVGTADSCPDGGTQ